MERRYKTSLNIIGILLILSFFVTVSYLSYKKDMESNTIVLVEDGLSINYLNGNNLKSIGNPSNLTFSVTNNNNYSLYYYIEVNQITSSTDNFTYTLKEKNNKIESQEEIFPSSDTYLASYVEIEPNTTHTYTLAILENKHNNLEAHLNIGVEDMKQDNFSATILANSSVKQESLTKVGEEVATKEEGLIQTNDDYGVSYYFRGIVNNNYVRFADLLWRIVKINGDGSVKLVLNDYLNETANYYNEDATNIEDKLNFMNSGIYTTLENFYQSNLEKYGKYLVSSKYCVDDSEGQSDNNNVYYLGYSRLLTDYNQSFSCLGKTYSSRIGLLTADEVIYAGASKNGENNAYYLYVPGKNSSWWTMTPAKSDNTNITYFEVDEYGKLQINSIGNYYRGVRPVINLAKKNFVSGIGTIDDPYTLNDLQ